MTTASVRDIDRGIKALLARMKANKTQLTVGVHGDAGSQGGVTLAQIADWNHEGTARIPARPFISQWYDHHILDNVALVYRVFQRVVEGKIPSLQVALNQIGTKFVAGIQNQMVSGSFVPNAASTIARKGSTSPLIDTGVLKSAIRFKVASANGSGT